MLSTTDLSEKGEPHTPYVKMDALFDSSDAAPADTRHPSRFIYDSPLAPVRDTIVSRSRISHDYDFIITRPGNLAR